MCHEESDTRLVVHIVDAVRKGHGSCFIRTVDTGVITILVGKFSYLQSLNPNISISVAFGRGKKFSYWHINSIYAHSGEEKCSASTVFLFWKGEKIILEAWKSFPDVHYCDIFKHCNAPLLSCDEDSPIFSQLERFVVIIYNKTSNLESVDETRMELSCQRS